MFSGTLSCPSFGVMKSWTCSSTTIRWLTPKERSSSSSFSLKIMGIKLTIEEVWLDEVLVDSADWKSCSGEITLEPKSTNTFYMAPKDLTFEKGQDYNLTVVTSRKKQFNFTLNVNENNTKLEKVKINQCYFYHWPPTSHDKFVGIEVQSFGDINVIVKEVWIDSASFIVSPGLWLNQFHSTNNIEISFPWKKGSTYNITIETVAGSAYQVNATAD
jgi:hypothetical protein